MYKQIVRHALPVVMKVPCAPRLTGQEPCHDHDDADHILFVLQVAGTKKFSVTVVAYQGFPKLGRMRA